MNKSPYFLNLKSNNNYKNKYSPSYENQIKLIIDNSSSYVTPKDYQNNKYRIIYICIYFNNYLKINI